MSTLAHKIEQSTAFLLGKKPLTALERTRLESKHAQLVNQSRVTKAEANSPLPHKYASKPSTSAAMGEDAAMQVSSAAAAVGKDRKLPAAMLGEGSDAPTASSAFAPTAFVASNDALDTQLADEEAQVVDEIIASASQKKWLEMAMAESEHE